MNSFVLYSASFSFLAALAAPIILRPLLLRAGIVDEPNIRSSHTSTAIRGMGISPAFAFIVGILVLVFFGGEGYDRLLWVVVVTVFLAAILGLLEDAFGIRPVIRALAQLLIGSLGTILSVTLFPNVLWWIPVGILVISVYINVANFMDGINGISGLHGIIVGMHYFLLGQFTELEGLTVVGLLLAAVFLAFIPWNLVHGKMFLGDVGSYFLGSSIGILSFVALIAGVHPVAVVAPVAIYLADTGLTLYRRVKSGNRWSEAHRSHVYQILVRNDENNSHVRISLTVAIFGAVSGGFGLVASSFPLIGWTICLPTVVLLSVTYLFLPNISQRRRKATRYSEVS